MKRILLMGLLAAACDVIGPDDLGKGELRVSFAQVHGMTTRVSSEIPDTGDFILTITDSKGNEVYAGKYGACPEVMEVPSGNYNVKVVSHEFSKPAFSSPQFGDEQCVSVPSGGVADVRLMCGQINSGVRLKISPDFLTEYPDGVLFLKSSEGKLMYSYSEKRAAYFLPGNVSLMLSRGNSDEVLMTRRMYPCEMLVLKVNVAQNSPSAGTEGPSASVSVAVDTTRNWVTETYEIGGGSAGGSSSEEALTVAQARTSAGVENVWVSGYIVGGDLTSTSASFASPFESRTNILIGPKSTTSNRSSCLSVQLAAGDAREMLNLVDNPLNLGRKVLLKGNIVEAYYGMPGMKNITDFELR
jgi:hypothetical protein